MDIIMIFLLVAASGFLSERSSDFFNAAIGFSSKPLFLTAWIIITAAAGILAVRKGWFKNLRGGRLRWVPSAAGGVISAFIPGFVGCEAVSSRIGAGILLGFYLHIIFSLIPKKHSMSAASPDKNRLRTVAYMLGIFGAINFAGAVYIAQSSFIYYWDTANYWLVARDIASGNLCSSFFSDVYNSIIELDYNYLAGLFSALFARLFGGSRTVFVLSVLNCYYLPFAYLVYSLCKKAVKPVLSAAAVLLLFPVALFLGLSGFVDIGGLVLCLLCFKLYFNKKHTIARYFVIGAILAVCIIFRRWYAFFGVSFIAAMLVDCLVSRKNPAYVLVTVLNAGFILGVFFMPLVTDKLLADYASLYSGYKFALSTDFKLFARYFGILPLAAFAAGSVIYTIKRDRNLIFAYVQMIVCFVLFVRTQTHGQQHLLLYIPALIFIASKLVSCLNARMSVIALAGCAVITANTFVPREQPQNLEEISHYAVIPDFSSRPRVRNDIKELMELKAYINDLCPNGEQIGILSSSFNLNRDLLENLEISFNIENNSTARMVEMPAVDSRDKDLSSFYNVDYMLVATPPQTHLAPESQTVITRSVESFVNGTDIALAYEKDGVSFEINGVTIEFFKKIRPNTESEISQFEYKIHEL